MQRDYAEIILTDLFGWGYRDVETLQELLEFADRLGIASTFDSPAEFIKDSGLDPMDINSWIYAVMNEIMLDLSDDIRDEYGDDVADRMMEFNPYINYMDSWFNNCLDRLWKSEWHGDIDFDEELHEKAIKCLVKEYGGR